LAKDLNIPAENAPGWRTAVGITVLYLLFFPVYWKLYEWNPEWHFRWFQGEDKTIEWITFGGFFGASLIFFSFHRYRTVMPGWMKIFFIGLAIFMFVCAGEEISWGQRILGFETPDSLSEINTQDEFNVHNIEFQHFHPKDVVSWALKLWGLSIPLILLVWKKPLNWLRPILSPAAMIPCFAIPELINLAEDAIARFYGHRLGDAAFTLVHPQLEEWMEMYWGVGVLLAALALNDAWRYRLGHSDSKQASKEANQKQAQQTG